MQHYNRRTLFPATLSVNTFFRLFRKKIFKLDYGQFLRFSARSELKIGAVVIAFVRNGRKPLAAVDINFNRTFVENRNYIGLVAVQRNYRVACRKPVIFCVAAHFQSECVKAEFRTVAFYLYSVCAFFKIEADFFARRNVFAQNLAFVQFFGFGAG